MGNKIKSFEDIIVWQKAHRLTLKIYKLTSIFPRSETFGLISQLKRSSSSIAANIVEGFYRNTTKELLSFLYNARGSLGETLYHLKLASDLNYINKKEYDELKSEIEIISKQLNAWIRSLKNRASH